MADNQIYILIAIGALAVIFILFFWLRKNTRHTKLTPLAALAFGAILAGLFASENRILGYSLIAAGIILSIVDMIIKLKHP